MLINIAFIQIDCFPLPLLEHTVSEAFFISSLYRKQYQKFLSYAAQYAKKYPQFILSRIIFSGITIGGPIGSSLLWGTVKVLVLG